MIFSAEFSRHLKQRASSAEGTEPEADAHTVTLLDKVSPRGLRAEHRAISMPHRGRYLHQLLRCELRLICSILSQPMKSSENCRQLTAEEVALAEAAVTNEQGSPLSYGCLLPAVGGGEREGSEDE